MDSSQERFTKVKNLKIAGRDLTEIVSELWLDRETKDGPFRSITIKFNDLLMLDHFLGETVDIEVEVGDGTFLQFKEVIVPIQGDSGSLANEIKLTIKTRPPHGPYEKPTL